MILRQCVLLKKGKKSDEGMFYQGGEDGDVGTGNRG